MSKLIIGTDETAPTPPKFQRPPKLSPKKQQFWHWRDWVDYYWNGCRPLIGPDVWSCRARSTWCYRLQKMRRLHPRLQVIISSVLVIILQVKKGSY